MAKPFVEVITSVERRRHWSREEKERIVAASLEPGAVASDVARAAGIHTSQLFRWRKMLCEMIPDDGSGGAQLVPTQSVPYEALAPALPEANTTRRRKAGLIKIVLEGSECIRVDRDVDAEALARVLEVLRRR
jgi:transposase